LRRPRLVWRRVPETGRRAEEPVMQSPVAVAVFKRVVDARLRRSEEGQDLLEYGLLIALIALFAIGAVTTVGNTVNTVFWQSIASNF